MNNLTKTKKIILGSIIGVLIGVLVSVSYAMFTYTRTGVTNQLVTGDIYMKYLEGSNLNLSGAMPSSSYPTATEHNYFQFQITGKNTHPTNDISYTLKLNHGDVPSGKTTANRIADTWLYFKLVEVNGNVETTLVNDAHYTTIPNSVIYTTTIPHNTMSETTKTYRLYARIDNNLTIGNTTGANYSQTEWNNLFASIVINAEGTNVETTEITLNPNGGTLSPTTIRIPINSTTYGTLPEPTNSDTTLSFDGWYTEATGGSKVLSTTSFTNGTSATTLYAHWEDSTPTMEKMCPDCVYITSRAGLKGYNRWYTTWNTAGQTPTVVNPSNWTSLGVEDNYDNVYQNTGSTYFLGIKLNENYQIEKAYGCDVENNIPYCLESDANGDKYQYNIGILNAIFGEDKCEDSGSYYTCYGSSSIANIYNSGGVMAGGFACAAKANSNGDGGIWFGGTGC